MWLKESLLKASKRSDLFRISLLSVSVALFLLVLDFRRWRWQANFADTAYFHEITQSLSKGNWFGSHFGGTIELNLTDVLLNPTAHTINQIPDFPFNSQPSQFYNHAYLILIPIAFITAFLNYRMVIDSLVVLITLVPFIVLLLLLRRSYRDQRRKVLIPVGILSAVILISFPGINYVALGQFYPDRLIIIFLPLMMLAMERFKDCRDRRSLITFIVLALLSMSVTERGSLYVALVTISQSFFHVAGNWRKWEEALREIFPFLWVGAIAFTWSVVYIRLITRNQDTGNTSYSITHMSWANNPLFTVASLKLIILCLPFFFSALRYADLLILGFVAMLPNLLGTYMFNLRTAWIAHYMSYLSATLIGILFVAIKRNSQRNAWRLRIENRTLNMPLGLIVACLISVISIFVINPVTDTKLVEPTRQARLGTFSEAGTWWSNPYYRSVTRQTINNDYDLANRISANSSVVASETTAPFVGGRVKTVDYYPFNLKIDEYVLIFSSSSVGQPFYASAVANYASPEGSLEMTAQATRLLNSDCYEIVGQNVNANLYLFHRLKTINDDSMCHPRIG